MRKKQPNAVVPDETTLRAYLGAWAEFRGQKTLRQICLERGLPPKKVQYWGYNRQLHKKT